MKGKRVALITGAAKGIGKAITLALKKEGHTTIAVDMNMEAGRKLAQSRKGKIEFLPVDISSEEEVKQMFHYVIERYGQLDVLVNNAGIIRDNLIWNMPLEDYEAVMNTNMRGTWLMCREAAGIMKEQKHGRIINIASRAWLGNRGQSNYSASKAGIIGLTRVLALELGKFDVLVNAIAPGLIDTPLTKNLPAEVLRKLIDAQPTRSMGLPEDIANVVLFLASEKTRFITGQTIYVDGGKSIGAGI